MIYLYSQIMLLEITFTLSLYILVQDLLHKDNKRKRLLIGITIWNVFCTLIIYIQIHFDIFISGKLNYTFIFWILSGLIMGVALYYQILIIVNLYKRRRNHEFYHYNIFGKKVFKNEIVLNRELWIFLITIPFFLLPGGYFVARLINFFLYNHL